MGFLDKLFGRDKATQYTATDAVMNDEQFWLIIDKTRAKAGGDYEAHQELLEKELTKIPAQEIILFDNKFRQLRGEANNWDLWAAVYIIHGGCGDDSFNDFREWVIAQGKDFYTRTISDPGTLAAYDPEMFDIEWEGMGYIANTVFEKITGTDMPQGIVERTELAGEEWNEDGDDLMLKFPMLWKKYMA